MALGSGIDRGKLERINGCIKEAKWGTLFGFFVGHDHLHQSVVVFYDSGTGTTAERLHERERERKDGLKRSLWGGGFHLLKWHIL